MTLPWLTQPVQLHSSRDPGACDMTAEQCAYKWRYWVFWYEADHRYALPTVALFVVAILVFAITQFAAANAPRKLKQSSFWLRLVALGRFLSYKNWRLGSWNSASLGVYLLGGVGVVYFFAMTLGPRPYYWPNTMEINFGDSPPIATRAGYMALGCMPFIYLLGAKASPISAITGISHEKLNIWHNWAAWAMFVLALIHTFPFIVYHQWKGDIVEQWNMDGMWLTGVIALLAQAWLTFMSIRSIRDRYYEFFKATHFFFAAAFFIFFMLHCDWILTSWDYFIATAVLYALSWFYTQAKTFLEHGLCYARLSMVTPNSIMIEIETNTRWTPGQHVYLRFLTCGIHSLTAHPFTISSIPLHGQSSKMIFYVQPRGGITGRLAKIAEKSPTSAIPVLLDGPYGGVTSRWFGGFDRTLIVAGGAGAGFSLPMVEHFLLSQSTREEESELEVVVSSRDPGFQDWYCQALDKILERHQAEKESSKTRIRVQVHKTGPSTANDSSSSPQESEGENTKETLKSGTLARDDNSSSTGAIDLKTFSGRANIPALASELTKSKGSVGMLVCGPSSMVFDLNQIAASAQSEILRGKGSASEVWFYKESFSI